MPKTSSRKRFVRKKYVVNYRVQTEIISYILILFIIVFGLLYVGLRSTFGVVDDELMRMSSTQSPIASFIHDEGSRLISEFFWSYGISSFLMIVLGGIFISHRIAGPVFRLRVMLQQILRGEAPHPNTCRKHDFFPEIFELMREVVSKKIENKDRPKP